MVIFARLYYQSGSVLPARQYILIYILVTFGDDFIPQEVRAGFECKLLDA